MQSYSLEVWFISDLHDFYFGSTCLQSNLSARCFLFRYFAICRPLQYKPSASFYIVLVFATSLSVNVGRFLEFRSHNADLKGETTTTHAWKYQLHYLKQGGKAGNELDFHPSSLGLTPARDNIPQNKSINHKVCLNNDLQIARHT